MSFKWVPYYIHYGNASVRHIVTILKIWDTLCNLISIAQLEKRENIQGSMLLLVKLLQTLLKVALVHGCCLCFFKLCKWYQMSHIFSILKNHLQHSEIVISLFPPNVFGQGKDNFTRSLPALLCPFLTIGKSFRPETSNVIEQLKNFQIIQKMSWHCKKNEVWDLGFLQ